MDEEKLKEELEKWEREIALDPENAEAYSKRGTVLFVLGRKKEALASYDRALEINPEYEKAWNNKGVLLAYSGRKKKL